MESSIYLIVSLLVIAMTSAQSPYKEFTKTTPPSFDCSNKRGYYADPSNSAAAETAYTFGCGFFFYCNKAKEPAKILRCIQADGDNAKSNPVFFDNAYKVCRRCGDLFPAATCTAGAGANCTP